MYWENKEPAQFHAGEPDIEQWAIQLRSINPDIIEDVNYTEKKMLKEFESWKEEGKCAFYKD